MAAPHPTGKIGCVFVVSLQEKNELRYGGEIMVLHGINLLGPCFVAILLALLISCGGESVPISAPTTAALGPPSPSPTTPNGAASTLQATPGAGDTPTPAPTATETPPLTPVPTSTPPPATAMFDLSSSSGQAPFTLGLNNLSENASTFEWDFGDGSATSSATVPSHTYTTAGTFALTLTAEGGRQASTFTQTVTVEAGRIAEVKLQPDQPTVSVTDSLQFSAKAFDQFGNQLTDVALEWTTSEESGTIDQSGLYEPSTVAGQYEQAVTVSATKAGQTQQTSANVTVNPGAPAELVVEPPHALLDIGASQEMRLKILDVFGNEVLNALTAWKSDDNAGNIASGVFTAGTAAGIFQNGIRVDVVQGSTSLSETFEVIIRPDPLASIVVEPSLPIVRKNETLNLQATGLDQFGNKIRNLAFLWNSPELDVSSSGRVTVGDQEGLYEVTVQASFRDADQTTSLRVGVPPIWIPIEEMSRRRFGHSGTLLPDGSVLIAGGWPSARSAELYYPATRSFTRTDRLSEDRHFGSAVLLPDGKVLVVGGCNSQSAEVFEPEDGTFSRVPGNVMHPSRTVATATLLANGKVLIAGGRRCGGSAGWGESFDTAELFDPASGLFTWTTGTMVRPRSDHRATLLPSGEVLLSGGFTRFADDSDECLDSSELYDPATGTFRETGFLIQAGGCTVDINASAPLLPNGKVLLTIYSGRLELYDPTTEDVTLGSTWERRNSASVTLLSDGRVLIAGGFSEGTSDRGDIYDPSGDSIVSTTTMNTSRELSTAMVLATGEVLVTGGRLQREDGVWVYHRSAELFVP